MPETCENCMGLVKSWVYYAHQTHEINPWILKLLEALRHIDWDSTE